LPLGARLALPAQRGVAGCRLAGIVAIARRPTRTEHHFLRLNRRFARATAGEKVRWIASGTLSDIFGLVYRSIGAWQITLLNNRRLPGRFVVGRLDRWLLWVTVITA
jgi:hypothetical protein